MIAILSAYTSVDIFLKYVTRAKTYAATIKISVNIHTITIYFFMVVVIPLQAKVLTAKLSSETTTAIMP